MIAGFMLMGFLWLGLTLVVFGLACNAVWRAVMAPPGTPREAGCGSCGYELATLDGGRCSECGADLLKAGIVTRRNVIRTAGSMPAAIMGWTIIVATVTSVVLYAVSMASMFATMGAGGMGAGGYTSNYVFAAPQTYDAQLGEYVTSIDFEMLADVDVIGNWDAPPDSGTIDFVFTSGERSVTIAFADASANDWVMTDADGTELRAGTSITANDAMAALRAVGLTPEENETVPAIASELEVIIDTALADPFSYEVMYTNNLSGAPLLEQRGGGSMNSVGNPFATGNAADYVIPIAIFGVGFLIWIVGLVFIIRRRSRLIAAPRV